MKTITIKIYLSIWVNVRLTILIHDESNHDNLNICWLGYIFINLSSIIYFWKFYFTMYGHTFIIHNLNNFWLSETLIEDWWIKEGKVVYGQEPPSGESTTTECGFNYQLLAVITEVAQWGANSCSQPQPATDNGVRDGRPNWLVTPPTLHRALPPELHVLHTAMRAANHKTCCTESAANLRLQNARPTHCRCGHSATTRFKLEGCDLSIFVVFDTLLKFNVQSKSVGKSWVEASVEMFGRSQCGNVLLKPVGKCSVETSDEMFGWSQFSPLVHNVTLS